MRILMGLLATTLTLSLTACKNGDTRTATNAQATGGGSPTTNPTETPKDPGGTGTADSLAIGDLSGTAIYTEETAGGSCVNFVVTASAAGAAAADVGVVLTVQADSTGMTEKGKVTPNSGVTDAQGKLEAVYCSGKEEGTVMVVAKAGALSTNSAKIVVTKKPAYAFVYSRADTDPSLIPSESTDAEKKTDSLYLNTFDSGPQDCTTVYFKLTKNDKPVVGEKLTFSTQVDYPKGSKLAKRAGTAVTATEAVTNKKYLVYEGTSSGSGEFGVPVCAGVSLGTILISSTFVDPDEGRSFPVRSPVIRITAGLTNFINLSLTFDPVNGRTLKAFYNTNSDYEMPFQVQLGARFDGSAIVDYPVGINTEVGRYKLENGGLGNVETGVVKGTLQALHLVDNYPYAMKDFEGFIGAQTRCDPTEIAAYAASKGLTEFKYSDLTKNWRSTMVYTIRGQEHFNDANKNGLYDVGGDGFWDKNQNGVYDTGDELTFDAKGDGLFDKTGEWFIDLPTPFVDVNEDGVFTATVDILVGDEYVKPNGARDADAFLWKYDYFPISMGASFYGLQRYRVQAADYKLIDPSFVLEGTTYNIWGIDPVIGDAELWGGAVNASSGIYPFGLYLHDLCGSLLPGGTAIEITFIEIYPPKWGQRKPTGHFYIQPGDTILEPSRQLLKDANGGASATINFNVVDHPSKAQSYPVVGRIEVPSCGNVCTGAVTPANPGVSCDGWGGYAIVTVKEPKLGENVSASSVGMQIPLGFQSLPTCNCVTGAAEIAGVCSCTDPSKTSNGTACI